LIIVGVVASGAVRRRKPCLPEFILKFQFERCFKKIVLVKFSRTMGSLLSSGALITDALHLAADSVGNEIYKRAILKSQLMSAAAWLYPKRFSSHDKLFPNFLLSLVWSGKKPALGKNIKTSPIFMMKKLIIICAPSPFYGTGVASGMV